MSLESELLILVRNIDNYMERAVDPAHLDDLNLIVDEIEEIQKRHGLKMVEDDLPKFEDPFEFTVRMALLQIQQEAAGCPLECTDTPWECPKEYEEMPPECQKEISELANVDLGIE